MQEVVHSTFQKLWKPHHKECGATYEERRPGIYCRIAHYPMYPRSTDGGQQGRKRLTGSFLVSGSFLEGKKIDSASGVRNAHGKDARKSLRWCPSNLRTIRRAAQQDKTTRQRKRPEHVALRSLPPAPACMPTKQEREIQEYRGKGPGGTAATAIIACGMDVNRYALQLASTAPVSCSHALSTTAPASPRAWQSFAPSRGCCDSTDETGKNGKKRSDGRTMNASKLGVEQICRQANHEDGRKIPGAATEEGLGQSNSL